MKFMLESSTIGHMELLIYYIIKTQVNQRLRFTTVKLQFINGGDLSAQDIDRHDSTWKLKSAH